MTEVVMQDVGNYPVVARPRFVFVNTDASNATITTAGWLNSVTNQKVQVTDIVVTNYASNAKAFYNPSIDSAGVVTLSAVSNPGEISLIGAAIVGNFPMFQSTNGDLQDSGFGAPLGFLLQPAGNAITAFATGGQTSATLLTKEVNRVTVVATAGDSIKLPVSAAGMDIVVINSGANRMQVFGSGTDTINGVATATGVSQSVNSVVVYSCPVAGLWFSQSLGLGFSAAFTTFSPNNAVTAFATGGQTSATLLTGMVNNVTVVATAADSVKLPVSAAGMRIVVTNSAALSMQVFGSGTDTINAVATAVGVPQIAGTSVEYYCPVAGSWFATLLQNGAGARFISGTTAAYGGGGTSNAFTVTGLSVASVGAAVIRASTNAVSIVKALPGTNTLTVTFSADPGASTTVDYIYSTAAQT